VNQALTEIVDEKKRVVHIATPISVHYKLGLTWETMCGEELREADGHSELKAYTKLRLCQFCRDGLNKMLDKYQVMLSSKPMHKITVSDREFHHILAALRGWQSPDLLFNEPEPIHNLATLGGTYRPMSFTELEELIERLNTE
jgi:hypothetical protein